MFLTFLSYHIRWWACPKELTNLCTGKEHYPTLSFQVIVDHGRMIRHVSGGEHGSLNDINICQLDELIKNDLTGLLTSDGLRRNKYGNLVFNLIDKNGKVMVVKGAYVITDGGYEPISIFINPQLLNSSRECIVWSEFIEAVRKDVECTFGILKNRFHFLKYGSRFHDQFVVEAAFVSCCILHNMLLILDGLDISAWELDAAWDSLELDPSLWDIEEDTTSISSSVLSPTLDSIPDVVIPFNGLPDTNQFIDNGLEVYVSPSRPRSNNEIRIFPIKAPTTLKRALIDHFSICYRLGRIQWPKNMKMVVRNTMNMPKPITDHAAIVRALAMIRETLVVRNSLHNRLCKVSRSIANLKSIGKGLFSIIQMEKNEVISDFIGEFISKDVAKSRCLEGKGGYQLEGAQNKIYDCYNFKHICKASMANSPTKCINMNTGSAATANARLVYDRNRYKFRIVCLTTIYPNDEILFNYSKDYVYPDEFI